MHLVCTKSYLTLPIHLFPHGVFVILDSNTEESYEPHFEDINWKVLFCQVGARNYVFFSVSLLRVLNF
jgi:hypothetical protein